jgi:hypothetical protein
MKVFVTMWVVAIVSAVNIYSATITRGPYGQKVNSQSALIVFKTDSSGSFSIEYGTQPGIFNASVLAFEEPESFWGRWEEHIYNAQLSNLLPDTRYYYRIKSGFNYYNGIDSLIFKTAPLTGDPKTRFSFFVASDMHIMTDTSGNITNSGNINSLHARYKKEPPELWISPGDVEQNRGCMSHYYKTWWDPFRSIIQKSFFLPAIGNHDEMCQEDLSQSNGFSVYYFAAWYLPENELDGSEWYYSQYWGNTKFIFLHGLPVDTTNAQYHWLIDQLSDTTPVWKIIVSHYPNYSTDDRTDHRGLSNWGNHTYDTLCHKYGVDLFITGHITENYRSPLMTLDSSFTYRASPEGITYEKSLNGPGTLFISDAVGFDQSEFLTVSVDGARISGIRERANSKTSGYDILDRWSIVKKRNNFPPVATINKQVIPTNATIGQLLHLTGVALDNEDGVLSNGKVQWKCRIKKPHAIERSIDIGQSVEIDYTPSESGEHLFYFSGSDNQGLSNYDSLVVYVTDELDVVKKIDFGTHTRVTTPSGWINIVSVGWSGTFSSPDPRWGMSLYDIPDSRFIMTPTNASWKYPLESGNYYVSVYCGSPFPYEGLSNSVGELIVENDTLLKKAPFYFGEPSYTFAYNPKSLNIGDSVYESGHPRSRGAPAQRLYYPITITDDTLHLSMSSGAITGMIIYKITSTGNIQKKDRPFRPPSRINTGKDFFIFNIPKESPVSVVEFYALNGKCIYRKNLTMSSQLQNFFLFPEFPAGLYFVKLQSGDYGEIKPWMKTKP